VVPPQFINTLQCLPYRGLMQTMHAIL